MKRHLFLLLFSMLPISVQAQAVETEITVLGITLPTADYNKAVDMLLELSEPYLWSSSVNATGVTVRLANFGIPMPMPSPSLSTGLGGYELQYVFALADIALLDLRRDADLVLVFTGDSVGGVCGAALQSNWTALGGAPIQNRWNPDPITGLDLNGSEDSFIAVIGTKGPCATFAGLVVHEVGHLLGAGHDMPPATGGEYLFTDSHAKRFTAFGQNIRTIVTNPQPAALYWKLWSQPALFFTLPNPLTNNRRTVQTTGRSVANYRTTTQPPPPVPPPFPPPTPLPPGCGLSTPVSLTSVLVAQCDPFPYTHYALFWGDVCPGATSHYEVEKSHPYGQPWQNAASTFAPWVDAWISGGSSGGVRVRACNGSTCTVPSNETIVVPSC